MSRRRYTVRAKCKHDGCDEWTFWEASTRKDETRLRHDYAQDWRCSRHRNPGQVLSPTNTLRVTEIVADKSKRYPHLDLFWSDGSGFAHGLGWKAWASDFQAGTRIRVTVEVLPPVEGREP